MFVPCEDFGDTPYMYEDARPISDDGGDIILQTNNFQDVIDLSNGIIK